ncbi:hypothetical protein JCM3766R1_006538 [Sporobolomyces carnicolor]
MSSISHPQRPASIAAASGTRSMPSLASQKRSIKNPFRRQQIPPSSAGSLPPPAYSTLPPTAEDAFAPPPATKQKAASLFSWKSSGKMSWIGFSSLRGKSELAKQERQAQAATHPELPSSADRLKSTWKRRQNRHGVLEFEFQPPFLVELDESLPPQARESAQLGSLEPSQIAPRSTYTPSPVPPISPRGPRTRETPPPSAIPTPRVPTTTSTAPTPSRLPKISERPLLIAQASTASSAEPSPELAKHTFSQQFPLPPARRPSSAELVSTSKPPVRPSKSLLAPPRANGSGATPPNRFTSSNLPRPKNGPYTASNPYPSMATTTPLAPRVGSPPTTTTTIRKPISIPARTSRPTSSSIPSASPRVVAITNSAGTLPPSSKRDEVERERVRTSWDSTATVTRSSSASGASEDTAVGGSAASIPVGDLRKRTTITVGSVPQPVFPTTTKRSHDVVAEKIATRMESGRIQPGDAMTNDEKQRWEKEVEAMFSEDRMKDLLVQLGI